LPSNRKPNLATVLIILVVGALIVQSGAITWAAPVKISFSVVGTQYCSPWPFCQYTTTTTTPSTSASSVVSPIVSFLGGQRWYVYDKSSHLTTVLDSSRMTLSFDLSGPNTNAISAKNTGWIRVYEWFQLADPIPGNTANAPYVIAFTRTLTGTLTTGTRSQPLSFIPWTVSGIANNGFFSSWAGRTDVVFWSGDSVGTERAAVFYIILDSSKRPAECGSFSLSCYDVSDLVAKQQDFTITAAIQENWRDYWFGTILNPTFSCDATTGGYAGSICIKNLESRGPIPIAWSAKITDFLYYTTMNGTPTYIQTKSSTAIETATIHISTTIESGTTKLIIREVHTNTTITGTDTIPAPNGGLGGGLTDWFNRFCSTNPSFAWLCSSSYGVPNWLIAVGVILVLLFLLWPKSGSSLTIKRED